VHDRILCLLHKQALGFGDPGGCIVPTVIMVLSFWGAMAWILEFSRAKWTPQLIVSLFLVAFVGMGGLYLLADLEDRSSYPLITILGWSLGAWFFIGPAICFLFINKCFKPKPKGVASAVNESDTRIQPRDEDGWPKGDGIKRLGKWCIPQLFLGLPCIIFIWIGGFWAHFSLQGSILPHFMNPILGSWLFWGPVVCYLLVKKCARRGSKLEIPVNPGRNKD